MEISILFHCVYFKAILNLKHDLLFVKMVWCMIALILLSSEAGGNVVFLKRLCNVFPTISDWKLQFWSTVSTLSYIEPET